MIEDRIKTFLFGRLERVYGPPRNPDGLASELARHLPSTASDDGLELAAERLIANRRATSFPPAADLIAAVRAIPGAGLASRKFSTDAEIERDRQESEAVRRLRGSAIAHKAVSEGWAPSLVSFARENLREPNGIEIERCIATARRNDAIAREMTGTLAGSIRQLRDAMHYRAERDLGLAPLDKSDAA